MILSQTDIAGAKQAAENIRQQISADKITGINYSVSITVSIGVSSFGQHRPSTESELIIFADQALYKAKEGGRNKVVSLL